MPHRTDEDFTREVESHIALETDRLISEGMTATEAREAALRRFGNVTATRERFYESRRVLWLEQLRRDVSHGLRSFLHEPSFTAIAILTLAIGIGATTAVATQVEAVFLQAPPVGDAAALRTLAWTSPRRAFTDVLFRGPTFDTRPIETFPDRLCRQLREDATTLAGVSCWRISTAALTESALVRVHAVSGNYFQTLQIQPRIGRTLNDDDDRTGAALVAMARDPKLFGRTIAIHGHLFTIVGILPSDFTGLAPLTPADILVPYAADLLFPTFQRNTWAQVRMVVRLAPGVSDEQARLEAEVATHQFIQAQPPAAAYDPPRLLLQDLSARLTGVQQNLGRPLALLGAAVAILLVITCANIGGLLFARGRARSKEIATRLALGGSRRRVVQQLVTESLLLSAGGGIAGVALAYAFTPLLPRLLNELGNTNALGLILRPDARILFFSLAISIACGLAFGLLPAIGVTSVDPMRALAGNSSLAPRSRLRAGKAALAVQLALSMVVLVMAGLLVRTMINLRAVPLGYQPEGLLFVETSNPVGRPRAVVDATVASLRSLPGVISATASQWPIFNNAEPRVAICTPGNDASPQQLDYSLVVPGFFDTWGVKFVRGRDIDDSAVPQVVVNETFVRRYLQGMDPLAAAISIGTNGCPGRTPAAIVGVVADHIDRQRVEVIPAVYGRYPRGGALYVTTYAVRAAGAPSALLPAVRWVIAEQGIAPNRDATLAVDYRDGVMRQERLLAILFAVFGTIALLINCLGIYGLAAYTVTSRTPEIGLRMALGAHAEQVARMVVRDAFLPVSIGIAIGGAAAIAAAHALGSFMFGVPSSDPMTIGVAITLLVAAALCASWLPARRASRIDPVQAVRCE